MLSYTRGKPPHHNHDAARVPDVATRVIDPVAAGSARRSSNFIRGARFRPLFAWHAAGEIAFAVTTTTIAEVLTGPFGAAFPR